MPNAFSDVYTYRAKAMLLTQIRHVEWSVYNISIEPAERPHDIASMPFDMRAIRVFSAFFLLLCR